MLCKNDLGQLIVKCLKENNGKATIVEVSRYIWKNHEEELRGSGDLFYTWQYDFRWQATDLRKQGVLKKTESRSRYWEMAR
jgi:hypothetical protein